MSIGAAMTLWLFPYELGIENVLVVCFPEQHLAYICELPLDKQYLSWPPWLIPVIWMIPATVLSSSLKTLLPLLMTWDLCWQSDEWGVDIFWASVQQCPLFLQPGRLSARLHGQASDFCVSGHRTKSRKVSIIWFGGCNLATQLLHSPLFALLHGMFIWKNSSRKK